MKRWISAALAAVVLSACGGGGDAGSAQPAANTSQITAEGMWGGTGVSSAQVSADVQMLVLDDGEFWMPYGHLAGSPVPLFGFMQGHFTQADGTLVSADAKDFGSGLSLPVRITSSFNSTSLTAMATATEGTVSLTLSRPASSSYVYSTPPDLSAIAGTWQSFTTSDSGGTLNIAANGIFNGAASTCTYSGVITPKASGKNVFNVAIAFGPAPCPHPNSTASGIAVSYPVGTSQRQLLIAVVSADRSSGIAIFGLR